MILPDHKIVEEMVEGNIAIEPLDVDVDNYDDVRGAVEESSQIQPSSVDLRLGKEIIRFNKLNKPHIDPFEDDIEDYGESVFLTEDDEFVLGAGEFVLAQTKEWVEVSPEKYDLRATVHGRSSWARVAIQPHLEAGYIDAGFFGNVTLEVMNSGPMPIVLRPGRRFCQIEFARLEQPAHEGYNGKYNGQETTQKSRLREERGEYE